MMFLSPSASLPMSIFCAVFDNIRATPCERYNDRLPHHGLNTEHYLSRIKPFPSGLSPSCLADSKQVVVSHLWCYLGSLTSLICCPA